MHERIPGKGVLSTPGIPDLIGWIPAQKVTKAMNIDPAATPLFIEVKRPKATGRRGGVKRVAQIRFIEDAKADGCIAFFADSWDDVVRELTAVGIKKRVEVTA